MLKDIIDWRGGECSNIPDRLMAESELRKAWNCHWDNGLTKRNGIRKYSTTDLSGFTGILGGIRAKLNSTFYTIVALDDDSDVNFYAGNAATLTAIDNTFDWEPGYNCEFAQLGDYVVVVNGYNKPAVIYYSGGLVVTNLESLDERIWEDANWWAGQYDASEATPFIDDTTDAQDAGTDDFQLASTTNNDGFYIACDFPFTKAILKSCHQATGSPVDVYEYWNGSAWTAFTPTAEPSWTAAEGDKTLTFDLPLSSGTLLWQPYDTSSSTDGVTGKYLIRVTFSTAPSAAFSCDYVVLSHTQYLTQILGDERPNKIAVHNSQVFMSVGNIVNFSPINAVTGWREGQAAYFNEGGEGIQGMESFNDRLVVFKPNTLYTLDMSNYVDPIASKPLTAVGTKYSRSIVKAENLIAFTGIDGIYIFDGNRAVCVSKHVDAATYGFPTCGVFYKGRVWLSSSPYVYVFDPDSYRTDLAGDGRVSFFIYDNHDNITKYIYSSDSGDTGYLLALREISDVPQIARCDNGATDIEVTAEIDITMTAESKYMSGESLGDVNNWGRIKPLVKTTATTTYTLLLKSEYGDISTTCAVSPGIGYETEDISIPYTLDGKNISVGVTHSDATAFKLIGFSFSWKKRRF